MAKVLNYESEIQAGSIIEPWHISQSVDAFTGAEAYDITISGSLVTTGSIKGTTTLTIGSKATIGTNHTNTGTLSTIAGGTLNTASEGCVFIGGGQSNSISGGYGNHGVIVGGRNNTLSDSYCGFIGGGSNNCLAGSNTGQVIVGGDNNTVIGADAGILGGINNCVDGHESSFIIGTNLTSSANFTTYVNNLDISGSLKDSSGDTGTSGQILSSTGAGLNWINNTDLGDYSPYITGSTSTGILPTATSANNCTTIGNNSTIAGGTLNTGSGDCSFIGGGESNSISGYCHQAIVGGCKNSIISSPTSTIAGGKNNSLSTAYQGDNFIGGGNNNCIDNNSCSSIIGSGNDNRISTDCDFYYNGILGGCNNLIAGTKESTFIIGSNITASTSCTTYVNNLDISGSLKDSSGDTGTSGQILSSTGTGLNWIDNSGGGGDGDYSPYITGSDVTGILPTATSANNCTTIGNNSTIAGGTLNTASAACSFIGGGQNNSITGCSLSNIVGGQNNTISGGYNGFIGAGCCNTLSAGYGCENVIVGGNNNDITAACGAECNFIGGGSNNTISGDYTSCSGILGGTGNCIDGHDNSFIIGSNLTSSANCTTYVNNLDVEGTISGSTISGSFVGDGSGLTGMCQGTVTSVTAGAGMTQTGTSTVNPTLNVIGGTAITVNANNIEVTAACNTAWNAKTTCTGTVTGTGVNNRVATWSGTTSLDSNSAFTYNGTTLTVGSKATIGTNHSNTGTLSTIAGGTLNTGSEDCIFIGGGSSNSISGGYGSHGVIVGGNNNTLSDSYCGFIGGGSNNCLAGSTTNQVIVGGENNTVEGNESGILGGINNCIDSHSNSFIIGSNLTSSAACTTFVNNLNISGSLADSDGDLGSAGQILSSTGTGLNWIDNTDFGDYSPYITGSTSTGILPTATSANNCTTIGNNSTIAGGTLNTGSGACGFIGGGCSNNIGSLSPSSVIVGGTNNTVSNTDIAGNDNFIGAGCNNSISSYCCGCNFIGGGCDNTISGYGDHNVIVGGKNNSNSGYYSGILGGKNNTISTCNQTFIIGSDITAAASCTTYVNNIHVTGSTTANAILQLSRRETTPTGVEGMIIASGSVGASKLYYYDGSAWNALF